MEVGGATLSAQTAAEDPRWATPKRASSSLAAERSTPTISPLTAASRFASGLPGSSLAAWAQKGAALATFPTRTRARQRRTFASFPPLTWRRTSAITSSS